MRFRLSSATGIAVLALAGSARAQERGVECPECRCECRVAKAARALPGSVRLAEVVPADLALAEPLLATLALPGGEDEKLAEKILAEVDKRIRKSHDLLLREFRRMLDERLGRGPDAGRSARVPMQRGRPPMEAPRIEVPRIEVRPHGDHDRGGPRHPEGRAHTFVLEHDGRDGGGKARVRIEADGKVIEKEIPFHGRKDGAMEFEIPGGKGKVYLNLEDGFRMEGGKDGGRVFSRAWAFPGDGKRILEHLEDLDHEKLGRHLREMVPHFEKWAKEFGGEMGPRAQSWLKGLERGEDGLRGAGKRLDELQGRLERLLGEAERMGREGRDEKRQPAKKSPAKKSKKDRGGEDGEGEEEAEEEEEERDETSDL